MARDFSKFSYEQKSRALKACMQKVLQQLPYCYTADDERFLNRMQLFTSKEINNFLQEHELTPQEIIERTPLPYSENLFEHENILNALSRRCRSGRLNALIEQSCAGDDTPKMLRLIREHKAAHCGELALLLEEELCQLYSNINIKMASLNFYHHHFLIIDESIVIDPWDKQIYSIDELAGKLERLPLRQKSYNVLASVITFFKMIPPKDQYNIMKENNVHKPLQQIVNAFCHII
jgi:hypothetical protein